VPQAWPVTALTLGDDSYAKPELLTLLKMPVSTGGGADASVVLSDQLIAAKLNIANGSNPVPIVNVLSAADALLFPFFNGLDKLPYKVKPASATGQAMVKNASQLDAYNSNPLTPNCIP
jgi:hypothetical protein